ncbi:MAG TPA: alpha/beta hydrolase [Xanthobacteraceae bacterium]|jgi:acetyl esterase/lipase|nr:alpha/beta hydrolase [Xanthobacteraceae bacterium]
MVRIWLAIALAVTSVNAASAFADESPSASRQIIANAKPGPRHVPARDIPVPFADVSPQVRGLIAAPYFPIFNVRPKDAAEWKALVGKLAAGAGAQVHALAEKFSVTVTQINIAGVNCYIVAPKTMPDKNRNRLLVHVHGGGYVLSPGLAAVPEAVLMAGEGGFKIISIDYRMPPDFPYPAAMDDAMAVWKEAVKMENPKNMAIFGTSTGGGMTLAMVLRAKDEHLPLPAAIAPGTPWADLSDTGDSYKANEWLDNVLVTWNGWLGAAAKLYAGSHNLKEPYLSPIYGDFHGFPPTILTTGTRDLFLSNTVRTHRKLRRAGVEADLNVYEGQSHAQYLFNPDAPESKEAIADIVNFFDKHLGR